MTGVRIDDTFHQGMAHDVARVEMGKVNTLDVGQHLHCMYQVRLAMKEERSDPVTALQGLIEEELLVQRASALRLGLGQTTEWEIDRLIVQSLLKDMESRVSPSSISDEDIAQDFETHKDQLVRPERRKTAHVLARAQTPEAEAFANEVLAEFRRADDPMEVFERYVIDPPARDFEVRAEDLPPISEKAGFAQEFKDAVFAARAPGPLTRAVRTEYGWHAIIVEEIETGETGNLESLQGEIRDRLTRKRRFEALAAMVREAEASGVLKRNEDVIERSLRTDLFDEDER